MRLPFSPRTVALASALVLLLLAAGLPAAAADWPQWGGSAERNNVSPAKGLPAEWNVGQFDRRTKKWLGGPAAKGVLWAAKLGDLCYTSPVVAGDKVFIATNNANGYVKRYPAEVDLGVLLAFGRGDGRFLWQFSCEKLKIGTRTDGNIDHPEQGICSTPVVEGDRLWIISNRGEVVCLDTQGFLDGENDGPVDDEPSTAADEADVVWRFDMMRQLGTRQRYMCASSPTVVGDLVLAFTSNGVPVEGKGLAPKAPSFIALGKATGELIWADDSPGQNVLDGQWSSPAAGELGGVGQLLFAGGDGWLYSFAAERPSGTRPDLLWRFDLNPKAAVWKGEGRGDRNQVIATPVICDGRVYLATGQDPEAGEGQGDLWCIDPTKRGDVSSELAVDRAGKPVAPRREAAVDPDAGEEVRPNPNSAAVWHYRGHDANADGKAEFEEVMHRAMGSAVVADGLVVISDTMGLVHCLDAKTGRLHWTHDTLAAVWGSPLAADGKVYLGDEDGDLVVFALSSTKEVLAENSMGDSIYSVPVAVDGVLYIATRSHLFAIGEK